MKAVLVGDDTYDFQEIVTDTSITGETFERMQSIGLISESALINERELLSNQTTQIDEKLAAISAAKGESNE